MSPQVRNAYRANLFFYIGEAIVVKRNFHKPIGTEEHTYENKRKQYGNAELMRHAVENNTQKNSYCTEQQIKIQNLNLRLFFILK